jgi:hypothetical protein
MLSPSFDLLIGEVKNIILKHDKVSIRRDGYSLTWVLKFLCWCFYVCGLGQVVCNRLFVTEARQRRGCRLLSKENLVETISVRVEQPVYLLIFSG